MKTFSIRWVAGIVLYFIIIIAGCTSPKTEEETPPPAKAEEMVQPPPGSANMSAEQLAGMRLFMVHCNGCHPGGEKGEGPSLNDKNLPNFVVHAQVRVGVGKMPAFNQNEIPKEDLEKIKAFVKFMHETNS